MQFPSDPLMLHEEWARKTGRVIGLKEAILALEERAANLFLQRQDYAAENLRELATILKRRVTGGEEEIGEYKKEAERRNHEVRQKQPGHPGVVALNKTTDMQPFSDLVDAVRAFVKHSEPNHLGGPWQCSTEMSYCEYHKAKDRLVAALAKVEKK